MLKKLPYYAKLSIRTSLLCCASTCIALAKVTSCSFGYSSNKLSVVSGNLRKLQIFHYDNPCVLNYWSNKKEASWIFPFIALKCIEKRVFEILCPVSLKDHRVQMCHCDFVSFICKLVLDFLIRQDSVFFPIIFVS